MSKMLGIWIKNSLTNYYKRKLSAFKYAYTFITQDDGAPMFFVIVKMVQLDTNAGCSDINSKMENIDMYLFKHDIPKSNLQIKKWMNKISISGETY